MKRILIASLVLLSTYGLSSCGGSGGGDSSASIFNFRGLWVASLALTSETCNVTFAEDSGAFPFILNQSGDVVTLDSDLTGLDVAGFANENSVTMVGAANGVPVCPGDQFATVTTLSLDVAEASGDISSSTTLTYFFECPVRDDSCQIVYSGDSLRISGSESTSGLEPILPETIMEPLLF